MIRHRLVARAALAAALAATSIALASCGCARQNAAGPIIPEPTDPVTDPVTGTVTPTPDPTEPTVEAARPQELAFPDQDFRKEQPAAGAPRPFQLPEIKPFKLTSGMTVYLVEQHTLPVVSIDISFDGGGLYDTRGKEGLASVCMSMMSEGTQALDKIQFNEALADIASSVDAYAENETHGVSMRTLTKHFDATFALFRDVVLTPGFRQDDLERMIKRRLDGLKQAKASPASVQGRVFWPVMYGPKHAFGALTTEASLGAITLDDCKKFHASYVKPGNARLFVVGDMTADQVRAAFEEPLAAWKGAMPKAPKVAKAAPMKGSIFLVDIPGAAQSSVTLGHFGPARTAKDYTATSMMATILGGGFTSRVNMNLREDKGYAYGAYGGFNYTRSGSTFRGGANVRTDSTYQTMLELEREIRDLKSGARPPSEAEIAREKSSSIQSLPASFATGRSTLGMFRGLVYFGLPLDYYNAYVERVTNLTAKEISKAAATHLDPDKARFVIAGDASAKMVKREDGKDVPLTDANGNQLTLLEALKAQAKAAGLGGGDLVMLDADGKVLATHKL
jgi:zinc protease